MSAPADPKRGWGDRTQTPDLRTTLPRTRPAHARSAILPRLPSALAVKISIYKEIISSVRLDRAERQTMFMVSAQVIAYRQISDGL